jgi:hypothetical protein
MPYLLKAEQIYKLVVEQARPEVSHNTSLVNDFG